MDGNSAAEMDKSDELKSAMVQEKIQRVVKALSDRTQRTKERLMRPITPLHSEDSPIHQRKSSIDTDVSRENSIFAKSVPFDLASRLSTPLSLSGSIGQKFDKLRHWLHRPLNPQGFIYMTWQFLVMMCYFYNCYGIFLRAFFPYQTPSNVMYWLIADGVADAMYLLDILMKLRVKILFRGLWVDDTAAIPKFYFRSNTFTLDVLSLTPFDLLYFIYGVNPWFRLCRVLKIEVFWDFFNKCDRMAKSPYVIRIARVFCYMLYLIHLNACSYYAFSDYRGIGINTWTYNGVGNAYVRCFLFALKAATSIGKNPKPTEESEYVFMTCSWLLGVFIFAILIGQIRDTLVSASITKQMYQRRLDRVHGYMQRMHLPLELQERVSVWFEYNWQENKGIDEEVVLDHLPKKMKTDLALYIHFNTLKKVQLFRGLETELLRELVLKLKPVLYLPGDYICRKGDVGKEMYIVNSGHIEVLGGESGEVVLATLGEGSVFGEVSLLAINEGNRRTADVRCKGYADMFVLNKQCLQETVKDYPGANEILKRKAMKLMKNISKSPEVVKSEDENSEVVIVNPQPQPHLAQTVFQILIAKQQEKSTNEENGQIINVQEVTEENGQIINVQEVTEENTEMDLKPNDDPNGARIVSVNQEELKDVEQLNKRNKNVEFVPTRNKMIGTLIEDFGTSFDSVDLEQSCSVSLLSSSDSLLSLMSCSSDDERSLDEKQIQSATKVTTRGGKRRKENQPSKKPVTDLIGCELSIVINDADEKTVVYP